MKKIQSRYPCSEINLERTQNWKITRSFCAKILPRVSAIILFLVWQVLKSPLERVIPTRILRQRVFFLNKCLKPENMFYFKCQHCSLKKWLRLSWLWAANFSSVQIIEFLLNNNETFLIELITIPCKYELSFRIEVVLNEAILHRSCS